MHNAHNNKYFACACVLYRQHFTLLCSQARCEGVTILLQIFVCERKSRKSRIKWKKVHKIESYIWMCFESDWAHAQLSQPTFSCVYAVKCNRLCHYLFYLFICLRCNEQRDKQTNKHSYIILNANSLYRSCVRTIKKYFSISLNVPQNTKSIISMIRSQMQLIFRLKAKLEEDDTFSWNATPMNILSTLHK